MPGRSAPWCCCSQATRPVTTVARTFLGRDAVARRGAGKHGIGHDEALVRLGGINCSACSPTRSASFSSLGWGTTGADGEIFIGVGGAALFTTLSGLAGGLPLFTLAWIGNRLTQSLWLGRARQGVLEAGSTTPPTARILASSASATWVGDALARQQMQLPIEHGYGWRALFFFAAVVAAARWPPTSSCCANHASTKAIRRPSPIPRTCSRAPKRRPQVSAHCCGRCCAAAPSAGVPAVLRLHDRPRDFQHPGHRCTCTTTPGSA